MKNQKVRAKVSLLVLRALEVEQLVRFYEALGLEFEKHHHGSGPEHYAAESDGFVFEIYPQGSAHQPTTSTRIGFTVQSVDDAFQSVLSAGGKKVSVPADSPWGRRGIVDDPEGHRVEIVAH